MNTSSIFAFWPQIGKKGTSMILKLSETLAKVDQLSWLPANVLINRLTGQPSFSCNWHVLHCCTLYYMHCVLWILGSRLGNKTMRHGVDWYQSIEIIFNRIDIQYQLLSRYKSQYHNCDIVMEFSSRASSSYEIKSTDRIESTLHDLKTKTHLTEGHLVLPILMAEGDHHLRRRTGVVPSQPCHLTKKALLSYKEALPTLSGSLSAVFKKSSPTVWFLHLALKFTHNKWINLRMECS